MTARYFDRILRVDGRAITRRLEPPSSHGATRDITRRENAPLRRAMLVGIWFITVRDTGSALHVAYKSPFIRF